MEAVFRMRLHDPRIRREKLSEEEKELMKINLPNQSRSTRKRPALPKRDSAPLDRAAEIYSALVVGTGDYIRKNGFQRVLIGLSGGIDSALTAAIAADALGKKGVVGVAMPSQYSSKIPGGCETPGKEPRYFGLLTIPITEVFQAYLNTLAPSFKSLKPDVTEENVQHASVGTSSWPCQINLGGLFDHWE